MAKVDALEDLSMAQRVALEVCFMATHSMS